MSNENGPSADPKLMDEAKVWTDPRCVEFDVDEVTAAGGPGLDDAGIFS